ncbi:MULTISPECIES: sirohydrochlorin chelatase [Microbacterium]|uniref:sirohydrochlorin chelatase n=1 Tax=Microbacterium TaxID=33882 RepID=UPI00217CF9A8|nr:MULTISPECIES: CbiX/SirB N-terminal domain-containing protein [Microbacterium]UWF77434.1 cobalamin biosynthesis protein CbiX [Microbacterium neungamense]WCM55597.1 cobalamin biosynthesis protein CbiX [Microbacterium sp. EF45047]
MTTPALLAVSHGTADVDGAAAVARLVARVAEELPGVAVHEAFVDVQQPEAATALAAIDGPVVIVPLLLSSGFHVNVDIGGLARDDLAIAPPLGPDPRLADVLAERLAQAGGALGTASGASGSPDTPVILAVAGSRDPASETDALAMAGLLAARLGRPVETAYLAAREPRLDTVAAQHPDAVVAAYLLAHGYFHDLAVRQAGASVVTEPLLDAAEPPAALVDLVLSRYRDAAASLG